MFRGIILALSAIVFNLGCMVAVDSGIPEGAVESEVPVNPGYQMSSFVYTLNGKVVGRRSRYDTGELCSESIIVDGKLNGLYREWHKNGQLAMERPYKNDLLDGVCKQFDVNGKLLGSFTMKAGTGAFKEWYPGGWMKKSYEMNDGKKEGQYQEWWDSEKPLLKVRCTYKSNFKEGLSEEWFRSGKPDRKGPMHSGEWHGEITEWNPTDGTTVILYYYLGQKVSKEKYIELGKTDLSLPKLAEGGPTSPAGKAP